MRDPVQLVIEDRAQQSLRQLKPFDLRKIMRALDLLESSGIKKAGARYLVFKYRSDGAASYFLRVKPKFRIFFSAHGENKILVEDIVSEDLLYKFFGGSGG